MKVQKERDGLWHFRKGLVHYKHADKIELKIKVLDAYKHAKLGVKDQIEKAFA
jgi:hypothetical protein